MDPEPRIHWFTALSSSGLFPCPTDVVSVSRSFGKRSPRSPAVRVRPPQSSFTSSPARSLSSPNDAYQGFGPSLRHHRAASTRARDLHGLAMFRPQAFAASRRFAPQLGSQACFIPQPHPGFLASRGFSLRAAVLPSSGRAAPMPLAAACSPAEAGCHTRRPRLRGLSPHGGALSVVRGQPGSSARSPPRVSVPSRFSNVVVISGYPKPSALDVATRDLRLPAGPV
jgi:hypothetical protein